MKSQNNSKIQNAFNELLENISEKDQLEHEARMLSFRFISEIQHYLKERNMQKSELADKIGTSPGYITQIFRGNHLLNFKTLAKIQRALDIDFQIETREQNQNLLSKIQHITTACHSGRPSKEVINTALKNKEKTTQADIPPAPDSEENIAA